MKTVIIIPARYASTRYPGKPLVELTLPDGSRQSLIELSWRAACRVGGVDAVYVATDDTRIADAARGFGAAVIMTSDTCRNGTERCAEAVVNAGLDADLIVNLQGDAPLTPHWFVEDLMAAMKTDTAAQMATPVLRLDRLTYGHFTTDRKHNRVGGTTAVFDKNHHALYFSKEVLPFMDIAKWPDDAPLPVYHHVGVYAYRPQALQNYMAWDESTLEQLEGLEQLRFLANGETVKCVEVDGRGRVFWELNNPEDVARIESVIGETL